MAHHNDADPFSVFDNVDLANVGKIAFNHATTTHTPAEDSSKQSAKELDQAFGNDFDPFMLVLGEKKPQKIEENAEKSGRSRGMTLEEMRQRRQMNDMFGSDSVKSPSVTVSNAAARSADRVLKKRMSFSDLVSDSNPAKHPHRPKRMSFTDLMDNVDQSGDSKKDVFDPFDEDIGGNEEGEEEEEDDDESDDDEEEEDDKEEYGQSRDPKASATVVIRVKVPPRAREGQIIQVKHEGRLFNIAVPADAARRGIGTFPVAITLPSPGSHKTSDTKRSKRFIHGPALLRQGRVFKNWVPVYVSFSADGFLTVFASKASWLQNKDVLDQITIHGFMKCGKIYDKEDSGASNRGRVWQMKLTENDRQANAQKIRDLKLWKFDSRIDTRERMKIGAVNSTSGKDFLQTLQEHIQTRIGALQKSNLAAVSRSTVRLVWDICSVLALFHVAVMLPLQIGYMLDPEGFFLYLDICIDIFFCIDVIINLRTSYLRDDGTEETSGKEIAKSYLRGFFFIDLASSVPLDRFLVDNDGLENLKAAKGLKAGKILKIARMLRIAKLLRLVRIQKVIARLEGILVIGRTPKKMFKLLVFSTLFAHINACGWSFMSRISDQFYTQSWQSTYADGHLALYDDEFVNEYVVALTWAVMTMTSVGMNIPPQNNYERCFALYMLFVSCGFYGFILGSMASLVASLDVHSRRYHERMDNIVSYMRLRNFPRQLSRRVLRYYRHYFEKKTALDERAILKDLSASLRAEVSNFLIDSIRDKEIFRNLPNDIQTRLFAALRPERFLLGEVIHETGDAGREMYIVISGTVSLVDTHSNVKIDRVQSGSFFGEIYAFDLAELWDVNAVAGREQSNHANGSGGLATKTIELYSIAASDVNEIFEHSKDALKHVREAIVERTLMMLNDLKEKIQSATLMAFGASGDAKDDTSSHDIFFKMPSTEDIKINQIRLARLESLCMGLLGRLEELEARSVTKKNVRTTSKNAPHWKTLTRSASVFRDRSKTVSGALLRRSIDSRESQAKQCVEASVLKLLTKRLDAFETRLLAEIQAREYRGA
eukprot:g337.t1